ncbi:MAG: hypothetical protein ACRDOD_10060 [Streptosporangiaceae bacterium]
MAVRTCPFCELRFNYLTELEWHLVHDHEKEWAAPDRAWSHATNREGEKSA